MSLALITTYATLQAAIADTLNRTDLTDQIKVWVQLAEAKFKRDKRCKKLYSAAVDITADDLAWPADYKSLDSWYHDGSTWFGAIEIVSADMLGELKAQFGPTGVPRFAALMDGKARFAPAPDGTYATKRSYWLKVVALSDSATSNWLLLAHPDAYLYGALLHSAPYLKDDPRLETWGTLHEDALNSIEEDADMSQFSGNLRVQHKTFGG